MGLGIIYTENKKIEGHKNYQKKDHENIEQKKHQFRIDPAN